MHKPWQMWTFVDFGQKRSGQDGRAGVGWGGGRCDGLRRRGFCRNSGGRFSARKAAEGCKTVASAYFRGRGACAQYDSKVILGAKTLDPKRDAYYGSEES